MKRKLILLISCILTLAATAQVSSVITKKDKELTGDFTKFWVVDQEFGYALGKTPAKFSRETSPQIYFTRIPTELIKSEAFVIGINDASSTSEAFFCLSYIPEEKTTAFGRRRFLNSKINSYWKGEIEGDYVIFKTAKQGLYLHMTETGSYEYYQNRDEASRWKIIYL